MSILKFRLICFPLCLLFKTNTRNENRPGTRNCDDCSWTYHSFRPDSPHAKYPSFVTCAATRGCSTRDSSGYERDVSPPSFRGMVICLPPHSQSPFLFAHSQKNLSIYFVVSLQYTTFASVEICKLGKMSLLTSVNPQWGLTTANEHLGQGRPPTPPWVGFATLPAIAPHPLRQTSCRRLIH